MKIIVIKRGKGFVSGGAFGTFYILNKNKGVKVLSGKYTNIKNLKASGLWEEAEQEARLYNDAYVSGVVPKCYGVRPVRLGNKYSAGIVLSYIKGKEIFDDKVKSERYKGKNVSDYLQKKIRDASGIVHTDMHVHNVLLRLNKHGEIVRAWAIDFSPSCCHRVKRRS